MKGVFGSSSEFAIAVENGDGGSCVTAASLRVLPHPTPISSRKSREYWTPSTRISIVLSMNGFSDVRIKTRAKSTLDFSSVTSSISTSSPHTDTMHANVSASQTVRGTPKIHSQVRR
ncbi:hypothetical protein GmHk_06G016787 [Glycine max]|nr:hypothetical protein GmHk_06G016787 [Glycine max]